MTKLLKTKNDLFNSVLKMTLLLLLSIFYVSTGAAQDIITKKDGEKMKVVIKEISDTQVKYVDYRDIEGIIFTMDRALIREIKFSYGKKMKEEGPSKEEGYYLDDKNQAIKMNFTALATQFLILTYERAFDPTSAVELSLKIPGIGFKASEVDGDIKGLGLELGYKLKLGSVFKKDGYRPKKILEGSYFRGRLAYTYSLEEVSYNDNIEYKRSHFSGGLDIGKQWILGNKVALDLYFGFHYFGGKNNAKLSDGTIEDDVYTDIEYMGGDISGNDNVAVSAGIRVGGIFGNYGKTVKKKAKKR